MNFMALKHLFIIIILFSAFHSFSQSVLKEMKIANTDTIKLEGIVFEESVKIIFSNVDSKIGWGIDYSINSIILTDIPVDSFIVQYRISELSNFLKHDSDSVLIVPKMKEYASNQQYEKDFTESDIIQKGYMERGITVGNNQDPVLNSKMNLQLEGKLSDDLFIAAKLNDEHIPIQPDGNTAKIRDIDEINIKIHNEKNSIEAGDIAVDKSYNFLKYNRKINGIYFKNTSDTNKFFDIGLAVSKGTFSHQNIDVVEGVQGPYKLNGNNGETFIIILPESEKVYLDGKLLLRGEQNDYTIDYNTSEIKFTAKNIITIKSRVIVEFEYRERNFASFNVVSDLGFQIGKGNFYAGFYQKKDAINQTIDFNVNDTVLEVLSQAGDNLSSAVLLNVDSSNFDERKILYKMKDTTVNSIDYTIFEYSTNPQLATYDVHFSYKGKNKGNYVLLENNINGRIYKWVAPVGGVPQGNYSIYTNLVSPKKQMVAEFGGNIALNRNDNLSFCFALSNTDMNLFSDLDDNNNYGLASKLSYKRILKSADSLKRDFFVDYSFVGNDFSGIDRFESPEFERDWNIDSLFNSFLNKIGIGIMQKSFKTNYNIGFNLLHFHNNYFGFKPYLIFDKNGKNINFGTNASLLGTKTEYKQSIFLRSKTFSEYHNQIFTIGILYEQEMNKILNDVTNILTDNSEMFNSYGVYLKKNDSLKLNYEFSYKKRIDYYVPNSVFKIETKSDNVFFSANYFSENFKTQFLINYRNLFRIDTITNNLGNKQTVNASINLASSIWKKSMNITFTGQISSGYEPKMQFVYIEVEPSTGNFAWQDFNKDGIKQIDEFMPAYYTDQANYRKIAIQTNSYIRVIEKKITTGFVFKPENIFIARTLANKIASKFSNISFFQLNYKSSNFDIFSYNIDSALNYLWSINNTTLLALSKNITLSYSVKNMLQIQFLTAGFENNGIHSDMIELNFNKKAVNFENVFEKSISSSRADYSTIKNYEISKLKYEGKIRISRKKIDFILGYSYIEKQENSLGYKLFANKLELVNTFKIKTKTQIYSELGLIKNEFKGDESSNIAYLMMDGLQNGMNITWQFSIRKQINNFMSLNFEYSGRKPENSRLIHSGNINLVAIF